MEYTYHKTSFTLPNDIIERFKIIMGMEFSQNEVDLYASLALERANLTVEQVDGDRLSELTSNEILKHIEGYRAYGN